MDKLISDGWDDEDIDVEDGLSDERNNMTSKVQSDSHLKESNATTGNDDDSLTQHEQEGWEWDDDLDGTEDASTFLPDAFSEPPFNIAKEKLISYIQDLHSPTLLKSLNEILDEECNNTEFALKLCRYFHQRENLREYTLDIEVPRMDYQVILSDEWILSEATEIRQHFAENPVDNLVDDMLLRSANQAILADIFPIITGPDKMIRIQFLANAVATKCRLVLDMRSSRYLQVDCTMTISIPSGMPSHSTKLDLAKFRLIIEFSPEPSAPFVNYRLDSIQPLVDVVVDEQKIHLASEAIDLHNLDAIEREWVYTNSYDLRDSFLESIMSTQTAAGLKSALLEIDGVVNVSSKFNLIKQHLVLPSADEILNAENDLNESDEQGDIVSNHGKRRNRQILPPNHVSSLAKKQVLPPPCPPPASHHGASMQPKPIIGGLLMSGISRLAKVASAQDEGQTQRSVLYRREDDHLPVVHQSTQAGKDVFEHPKKLGNTNRINNNDNIKVLDKLDEDGWSDDGLDEIDGSSDHEKHVLDTFTIHRKDVDEGPSKVDDKPNLFQNADGTSLQNSSSQNFHDTDNLTPELRMERDYLLQKLAEISQLKNDYLNTSSNYDVPYDTESGIIPTRKRFVSRAEILKLREIQID